MSDEGTTGRGPTGTHEPDCTADPEAGRDPDTDVPVEVLLDFLVIVRVSYPEWDGFVVGSRKVGVLVQSLWETPLPDLSRVEVRRRLTTRRRRDLPYVLSRTEVSVRSFWEDRVQGWVRRMGHGRGSSEKEGANS